MLVCFGMYCNTYQYVSSVFGMYCGMYSIYICMNYNSIIM